MRLVPISTVLLSTFFAVYGYANNAPTSSPPTLSPAEPGTMDDLTATAHDLADIPDYVSPTTVDLTGYTVKLYQIQIQRMPLNTRSLYQVLITSALILSSLVMRRPSLTGRRFLIRH